jgi:hypothetical protein
VFRAAGSRLAPGQGYLNSISPRYEIVGVFNGLSDRLEIVGAIPELRMIPLYLVPDRLG